MVGVSLLSAATCDAWADEDLQALSPAGLRVLADALSSFARVVVVAPESEQSASSHSLTLHRPLRLRRHEPDRYALDGTPADEQPLRHVADLPPRQARRMPWPTWVGDDVVRAFTDRGVAQPWSHQVSAAELAYAGRHVVIATGTASGKSLAYQLPIMSALVADPTARHQQLRRVVDQHTLRLTDPLHAQAFGIASTAAAG